MKRPDPITYIFGNPIVSLGLMLGGIAMAYEWWAGQAPAPLAIGVIVVASYSSNAYERLHKYIFWKREWDAMNGQPYRGFVMPKLGGLKYLLAGGIWLFAARFAITDGHRPGLALVVALFWLGSLGIVGYGLFRLIRRLRSARRASRNVPVALILSVPRQSPAVQDAYSALPGYCWPLFQSQ